MAKSGLLPAKPQRSSAAADQWVNGDTTQAIATAGQGTVEVTKRITIDIPERLHRRVMTDCAINGVKLTTILRQMIEERWSAKAGQ
jgi:hypothetical protein